MLIKSQASVRGLLTPCDLHISALMMFVFLRKAPGMTTRTRLTESPAREQNT